MPDPGVLLAVYAAFIAGLISPGPDLMLVTAVSLRYGRAYAVKAALGIASGVALWVSAGALGLAALLETSEAVWTGMRFVGGGLLIYMGARGLSAAIRQPAGETLEDTRLDPSTPAFGLGLLTNLGNPKAAVVLLGLTALLGDGFGSAGGTLAAAAGMPILTGLWFTGLAVALTGSALHQTLMARRRWLDAISSLAIALVGGLLIQGVPVG